MKGIYKRRFVQRYPGPFVFVPGVNGVDATFDVSCSWTNEHLVSTYYWDDREQGEQVAKLVTNALNHAGGWSGHSCDLAKAVDGYPGPFGVKSDFCPLYGEMVEVICQSTSDQVVAVHEQSSNANPRLIALHIAFSLTDYTSEMRQKLAACR